MRTLFKLAISSAALLSVAACAPDESPVLISAIKPTQGDSLDSCKFSDVDLTSGTWDVSSPQVFTAGAIIDNEAGPVQEKSSLPNTELPRSSPNDFIVDTLSFDYTSNPSIGLPATDTVPVYFVITAFGTGNLFNEPFFGTKAAEAARNGVAPGDQVEVNVGIRVSGRYRSSPGRVNSNRVVFPVTLTASGGCTAPQVPAQNGPCGTFGGINGVPLKCCDPMDTDCRAGK